MIMKPVMKSVHLQTLHAIRNRLHPSHPAHPLIESDLGQREAGYKGELTLNYQLRNLTDTSAIVLHNIRLPSHSTGYFQIDTLFLTPSYLLIIEAKNMTGTLSFNPRMHQLSQVWNNQEKNYPDPITQVEQQSLQLQAWLHHSKLPNLPVESLVAICHPKAKIVSLNSPSVVAARVTHANSLFRKIESYTNTYVKRHLTDSTLQQLALKIKQSHTPGWKSQMSTYNITKNDIIKGVHCTSCNLYHMKRHNGRWICDTCGCRSRTAHEEAIKNYALIFGRQITSHELSVFLQIPSISISQKLLKKMNLTYTGRTKKRTYRLPDFED